MNKYQTLLYEVLTYIQVSENIYVLIHILI